MQHRAVHELVQKARHILQNLRPESKSKVALQGGSLCCNYGKVRDDKKVGHVGGGEFSSRSFTMWKFQSRLELERINGNHYFGDGSVRPWRLRS